MVGKVAKLSVGGAKFSAQVGFRLYSLTIVAEIAGLKDERHNVIGFARPFQIWRVQRHGINGHTQVIDNNGGKRLPFGCQPHLFQPTFQNPTVNSVPISP